MNLEKRISAFVTLGKRLSLYLDELKNTGDPASAHVQKLAMLIKTAKQYNGWFTDEAVLQALEAIADSLHADSLSAWLQNYTIQTESPKRVGVIMAGNLPLVGFHDFLCVMISGHLFVGKLSSQDPKLLPFLVEMLIEIAPEIKGDIAFTDRLDNIDAVIATGSNNSSRYFEYYFGKHPHIIRKNRNSVAVLSGNETEADFKALGNDIFQYFGMGCRNVSKLYVPRGYSFVPFFEAIESFADIRNHNKFANNYDYNKAIYLLNAEPIFDNGFLLLRESDALSSPTAVLFYEYYDSIEEVKQKLTAHAEEIQCVVSSVIPGSVAFGKAQYPALSDYADGVDTLRFLLSL